MSEVKVLKIALEALLELKELDQAFTANQIAAEALYNIQREHYLGEPSPVVAEVIGAIAL